MTPPEGREALRSAIERTRRRRRRLALVQGAALGLLFALPPGALLGGGTRALAAAAAGAAAGLLVGLIRDRRAPAPALLLEAGTPGSRNLVLTGAELLDAPIDPPAPVTERIFREAGTLVRAADPARILPAARPLLTLAAGIAGWVALLALMTVRPALLPAGPPAEHPAEGISALTVTVVPPAYSGLPADTLRDPDEIRALTGSRIELHVESSDEEILLETLDEERPLEPALEGGFTGSLALTDEGFLALRPSSGGGRILGLTPIPDERPQVAVRLPGEDLWLPDGERSLEVEVEARDDLGLASLRFVFTRVSGFGEFFDFDDGELTLEVERLSDRHWRGRALWDLRPLELEEGDIVVYRAKAGDRHPDAPRGESDTWTLEISEGRAAVSGGFAGEDETSRYAISQQMVNVLTEQLIARRDSISDEEFMIQLSTVSAAQRRVRAEFVFMLGGELGHDHDHFDEDGLSQLHEEAHARADADVLEGRLAHEGRADLVRAIQAMSHAGQFFIAANPEEALRAGETALVFLQRAFSARRYILRAFSQREELDPLRRLTGARSDAVADRRPGVIPSADSLQVALRRVLSETARLAGGNDEADALARDLLRIDPASPRLRELSAEAERAAAHRRGGRGTEARESLEGVAAGIAALLREELRPGPPAPRPQALDRLEGALLDALGTAPPGGP